MAVIESSQDIVQSQSPWREAARAFRQSWAGMLGIFILILVILFTFVGPFFYPVDPFEIIWAPLTPPGATERAPLGTDYLGRDILAGLIHGGPATLYVGLVAGIITITIGILVGAFAGFYRGMVDEFLMRITEFFQVLPALLFAMVLVTLFTPTIYVVSLAIGIVSWPTTARLTRAEFLRIRNLEYVNAARSIGAKNRRIIWRVILPNALAPLIVAATLTVGIAILFEAGLSFLGLGDPNMFSWGLMIGAGREYILDGWWVVTLPGFMIFLTVLGFSLVGDGLNDAFNPKLRER
ncbi:ABC transporter permease [Sneathiella sp. CAU 1612]|jgi:peptide/nickel transport system permease protein|uniref:ABC transporter permease n=1 Tax=Sneathiella sedimenti TaxID=2816034 RepID=A0ABS3F1Y6_9PROT|nr:ABC transporter permease [Sneathiella sedimenti]MBO0332141.1 ABC transporter permease [Sneathiella sedimenti]